MHSYINRLREDEYAVFLFHGVVKENTDSVRNYTRKHIEEDYFVNFLKALKQESTYPLSIEELQSINEGSQKLPPRSYAITFDDGFENNASIAAPILEDLNIPATFYLTSDFINSNAMSSIDRISYHIAYTSKQKIKMPWNSTTSDISTSSGKIIALDDVRKHIKNDPALDPEYTVNYIADECGMTAIKASDDPIDKKMDWKQARALANHPLFTVGGHSHTHPIMSFLSSHKCAYEIETSISMIEKNCEISLQHYSYPEGQDYCYSNEIIDSLKKHNIVCCPTAIDGINKPEDDLFHLRRIMVT